MSYMGDERSPVMPSTTGSSKVRAQPQVTLGTPTSHPLGIHFSFDVSWITSSLTFLPHNTFMQEISERQAVGSTCNTDDSISSKFQKSH
jgi:hypothetical protein